ncbi:MAG: DUF3847 domain-containing protein [Clostridiales Family XIII bacterium]|jgi:hypothetical protein|nr:DUF3847 domain-containing protein [Clostridiales Family XIII bacterium]
MAKTTIEKIELKKIEMEQLQNEMKRLTQQHKAEERKARTNRLCKRHGLFESMLEGTIALTEDNFKLFLEKTVANDFGRRTLANLKAEQDRRIAADNADTQAIAGDAINTRAAETGSDGNAPGPANAANPASAGGARAGGKPQEAQKATV